MPMRGDDDKIKEEENFIVYSRFFVGSTDLLYINSVYHLLVIDFATFLNLFLLKL